jgi:hypothetical protein
VPTALESMCRCTRRLFWTWMLPKLKSSKYVVCLKSSVNGTRKQTKPKIQTN